MKTSEPGSSTEGSGYAADERLRIDKDGRNKNERKQRPMELKAWIQMGVERRETVIHIPDDEMASLAESIANEPEKQMWKVLQGYVEDWLWAQFGFGWEGGGYKEDLSANEGMPDGGLFIGAVTNQSSIPNTVKMRLDCPACRFKGL